MPIYAFRCRACGREFERLAASKAAEAKLCCPACASPAVEKVFSAFRVKNAGSGPKPQGCSEGSCPSCPLKE